MKKVTRRLSSRMRSLNSHAAKGFANGWAGAALAAVTALSASFIVFFLTVQ